MFSSLRICCLTLCEVSKHSGLTEDDALRESNILRCLQTTFEKCHGSQKKMVMIVLASDVRQLDVQNQVAGWGYCGDQTSSREA
jgi:hypothetical protein